MFICRSYTPSFVLAVFAIALFTFSFILHIFQVLKHRSWYFITILVALLLEIVGYVARSLAAKQDPYNLIYFIIQYFFIVTAPVLISAGIYAILSVLINRLGPQYSPLPPKVVLGVFITCDSVATAIQVAGAALIGVAYSNKKDPSTANNILLAGLVFQVVTFFMFLVLTGVFLFCAKKAISTNSGLRTFLVFLLTATLLVYLRTCFRLAETAQGLNQVLATHEVYFACLEFAPIAAAMLIFNIWHPGRCLGRKESHVV